MLSKLFFIVDIFSINGSRDKREIHLCSPGSKICIGNHRINFTLIEKLVTKLGWPLIAVVTRHAGHVQSPDLVKPACLYHGRDSGK